MHHLPIDWNLLAILFRYPFFLSFRSLIVTVILYGRDNTLKYSYTYDNNKWWNILRGVLCKQTGNRTHQGGGGWWQLSLLKEHPYHIIIIFFGCILLKPRLFRYGSYRHSLCTNSRPSNGSKLFDSIILHIAASGIDETAGCVLDRVPMTTST